MRPPSIEINRKKLNGKAYEIKKGAGFRANICVTWYVPCVKCYVRIVHIALPGRSGARFDLPALKLTEIDWMGCFFYENKIRHYKTVKIRCGGRGWPLHALGQALGGASPARRTRILQFWVTIFKRRHKCRLLFLNICFHMFSSRHDAPSRFRQLWC